MQKWLKLSDFELNHISLASFLWDIGKQRRSRSGPYRKRRLIRFCTSAYPDQTPQDAVPDQFMHSLLTEYTFKI